MTSLTSSAFYEGKIAHKLNYQTKRDRDLRRAVFLRDDFTCQLCGHRPADIPVAWDGRSTYLCLGTDTVFQWPFLAVICPDHIIPRCKGGVNTLENLQTLCVSCNTKKGAD